MKISTTSWTEYRNVLEDCVIGTAFCTECEKEYVCCIALLVSRFIRGLYSLKLSQHESMIEIVRKIWECNQQ